MRKLRDILKEALETGNSLHKGPCWGSWRRFVFRSFWETDEGGIWKRSLSYWFNMGFFLDPDYVRSLNRGQCGTLRRTRVPMTWYQSMGHKWPVWTPRCIGTERARTPITILFYSSFIHSFIRPFIPSYIHYRQNTKLAIDCVVTLSARAHTHTHTHTTITLR